jgi:hypothetical protein
MKRVRTLLPSIGFLLIFLLSAPLLNAQETLPISTIRQINQRLTQAGVPLTERQINYLKGLKTSDNLREVVLSILSDEQKTVLTGKGDSQTDIIAAIRRINQRLTQAGVPLTERQINYLKGLKTSDNLREVVFSILADEQKAVLADKGDSQTDIIAAIRRINQRLTAAGVPLTERQINYLKGLKTSDNLREVVFSILSDQQKAVLADKGDSQTDIIAAIRQINQRLTAAGVPLTERQINYLKGLKTSDNLREVVFSILSDQQKTVFSSQNVNTTQTDDELLKPASVSQQPEMFDVLNQNFPNPFNSATTISYTIAQPGTVTIDIIENNGQFVERIVDEFQNAGRHSVVWDASSYATGIYLYKITSGGFSDTKKLSYIK